MKAQLKKLPKRNIAYKSLINFGLAILVNSKKIIEIINAIAPEHLELYTKNNNEIIKRGNAGSIFIGKFSPEALGDYLLDQIMFYQLLALQDFHQDCQLMIF